MNSHRLVAAIEVRLNYLAAAAAAAAATTASFKIIDRYVGSLVLAMHLGNTV